MAAALALMATTTTAHATTGGSSESVAVKENNTVTPYLRQDGGRVFVNYLNLEGSSVVVQVVDNENRILYFERFTSVPVVEKAINFEKALSGVYKVEVKVSNGGRTFSESLKVVR